MLHLTGSALLGILPGDKMFQAQRLTPSCTRPVVLHGYGGAGNEVEDSIKLRKNRFVAQIGSKLTPRRKKKKKWRACAAVTKGSWPKAEKIPQATQLGTWSCSNWASASTTSCTPDGADGPAPTGPVAPPAARGCLALYSLGGWIGLLLRGAQWAWLWTELKSSCLACTSQILRDSFTSPFKSYV